MIHTQCMDREGVTSMEGGYGLIQFLLDLLGLL